MKYILIFIIGLFFYLASSSCKKCINCSYTFPNGVKDTTIKYDEYCDKKKVLKTYEDNIKHLADSLRGTYSCK
ncbi:MAG: hypothetical protein A2046_13075 [Bacteroidetes bacterium GWA2_30_7]|nr:MAG: hypothetical protein A2046_13075 [Bacteroidetes bacterium GWA2_30_7]